MGLYHVTGIFFPIFFLGVGVIEDNIKSHVISASNILPNKSYYDKLTILAESAPRY